MCRQVPHLRAACGWLALITTLPLAAAVQLRAGARRGPSRPSAPLPTQYYGLVHIGQPGQEFRVVFDTFSGELIIPGAGCQDFACTKHHRFEPRNSTSSQQIGWADEPTRALAEGEDRDTKSLSLLGADVSGAFMRDRLCVGGKGPAQLCGTVDFVALTEEADEPFGKLEFDGVAGLAPSSNDAPEFNVLKALFGAASGSRVFSFYLTSAAAKSSSTGELIFGGYRQSRVASDLLWLPAQSKDSWEVRVDDILVGKEATGLCNKEGCQAALDSGSSLLMMPGHLLSALMQRLDIDDSCSKPLPNIAFTVAGHQLTLAPEDYAEQDQEGCRLLFTSLVGGKGPSLVLGLPFFRKFYTVFDAEHRRIGVAPAKHTEGSPSEELPAGAVSVPLVGVRA